MTTIVGGDHAETGGDAEVDHFQERIPVARAVRIDLGGIHDEAPHTVMGGAIVGEDLTAVLRGTRLHPTGRSQPPLHRRLERVDEQRAKKARLQRSLTCPSPCPGLLDGGLYRLEIKRIDGREMIEALRDAPAFAVARTPVELFIRARVSDCFRRAVGVVHIVQDPLKVGR